jgi:hypothetical protein
MSIVFTFVLTALKGILYVIGGFLADVYKVFGVAGLVCVGLIITNIGTVGYFEGVPLIRKIPFIGSLPLVGDLAVGHVQARVNEAVAGARHGFAIEQQNAVAKAKADAEADSRKKALLSAAIFQSLLTDAQSTENQTSKDYTDALQRAARARKAAGLRCDPLDGATATVLRNHGFKISQ